MELMVSAGLLALVLGLALQILAGVSRAQRRAAVSFELHQQAITGLTALTKDLAGSKGGNSTRYPGGGVIVIGGTIVDHQFKWTRMICYYLKTVNGVQCLVRGELPLTPTDSPPEINKGFGDFPNLRVVARDIESLTFASATEPIGVNLTAARQEMGVRFSVTVSLTVPYLN